MTRTRTAPRLALLLAFAAAGLVAVPAGASAEALADSVAAMDPSIHAIRIFDAGETDGQRRVYRVVVAGEPTATRLFVQSVITGADGKSTLAWTSEIKELADLKLGLASINGEIESGGLTAFLEIANPAGDGVPTYELLVEADGTYRFGAASN